MKTRSTLVAFLLILFSVARADEGMWLMHLLGENTYKEMVRKGLKLSREQLYSINQPSLKDAIVIFNGGCTGEMVSNQGLLFTNHHCGYGAIAAASSVEKNYLRDGFWAKSLSAEIPSPGLYVQFLRSISDVTEEVEKELKGLEGQERASRLQSVSSTIVKRASGNGKFDVRVVPFFRNNQYLQFVYERYTDIRLVGTPPESIGKFGGDTDNWEWPRHTGDFSVFRVYAGTDGRPAGYSAANVPLKPLRFLEVSVQGISEGDYSMILGYPGSTNRYELSQGVDLKIKTENPAVVRLRDARLRLMLAEMKKNDAVRLKLASSYASIANYWKFFDGERKQLIKHNVYAQKKQVEQDFEKWSAGRSDYTGLMSRVEKAYADWRPYALHRVYMNEGVLGSPLLAFASSLQGLERALTKKNPDPAEVRRLTDAAANARQEFLNNEDLPSDQGIVAVISRMFYEDIPADQHPSEFYVKAIGAHGSLAENQTYDRYASNLFRSTVVLDENRWKSFVQSPDSLTLQNDPAYAHATAFIRNYVSRFQAKSTAFNLANNDLSRLFVRGMMEMNKEKELYPDANFTMRLSYGQVKSYRPRDAVNYNYLCTMSGVLEKYQPADYEFDLPANLLETARRKNFGRYADRKTGDLPVAFITTNDITGGNSGSPVIDARGRLIGLAFDGNYEALSHKIAFDKDLNRTICVDVRYVLWCIDKLGGASNIISELTLRQ